MPAPISTADLLDLSEGDAGHEAGRLERLVDFGVELVDLFEGEAFGFVDPVGVGGGVSEDVVHVMWCTVCLFASGSGSGSEK